MHDPTQQAAEWLHRTYNGLVRLVSPEPIAQGQQALLFGCRVVEQPGYPSTPMLASTLAVPHNGSPPFHPATDDPWGDLVAFDQDPSPRDRADMARRLNARGCVLTVDAALDGARATALPWKPVHEAPGWWERLLKHHFGDADISVCSTWDQVIAAVGQTGPDTRGVVWVRREINGAEATGHLLYTHNNNGQVVVLDGQSGGLAHLETQGVRQLVLARFRRTRPAGGPSRPPWRETAPDLPSAVRKAHAWLERNHGNEVILVDPTPADEMSRGWLFACNTVRFLRDGDQGSAMLDAAVVVPKDDCEPLGLPNSDPWGWLARWDA